MVIVVLICLFVGTLLLYALFNKLINAPERIECVDAGPVASVDPQDLHSRVKFEPMGIFRTEDGKLLTSADYQRITVSGNCMGPKGIRSGQDLLVEKIKGGRDLSLKKGDILLIHVPDKDIYKIRAYEKKTDKDPNVYETYYYDEARKKVLSSKPHKKDYVQGVVRYILPNKIKQGNSFSS